VLRPDPLSLPIRFAARDPRADGRQREVEIDRERVVVHRSVRGVRMAVKVPLAQFLGVALRLIPAEGPSPDLLEVTLAHRDRGLSIPLFVAADSNDIIAEWQLWARVLRRPLLITNPDGSYRAPFPHMGAVRVGAPALRRRRKYAVKTRRPTFPLRRRRGRMAGADLVYRGEREIIARD
jgi:hypothetical protein